MSIFNTIKNILVGSPKTLDDVFDKDNGHLAKAGSFIGSLVYTDQEKSEANAELTKSVQKFVVDTLDENTNRSRTRRDISVLTIKFYFLLIFITGMTYPINPEWSNVWFSLATTWQLGGLVTGVAAFFYGTHLQRSMKNKE